MKTANMTQDCDLMRKPATRKSRTVKTARRKSEGVFYPDLNDFLSQNQITTVNEYGVRGIYGRRIC